MEIELDPKIIEALGRDARDFRPLTPEEIVSKAGRITYGNRVNTRAPRRGWRPGAAIITLVALICVIGVKYFLTTTHLVPSAEKVYKTGMGQRVTVSLASGAQVVLAPASELHVDGNDVSLDGHAVFTVPHNESGSFTVRTRSSLVRVLGTTFSVRAYMNEPGVVAVAEGKVGVVNLNLHSVPKGEIMRRTRDGAVLTAGEVALIGGRGIAVVPYVSSSSEFSWTTGKLSFEEEKLKDIVPDLERWYNIDVHIDSHILEEQPVTITLDSSRPEQALSSLASILGARIERNGRTITFRHK